MVAKTITTWHVLPTQEQKAITMEESGRRAAEGKTNGLIESLPVPGGLDFNVEPPMIVTRIWRTAEDAQDWTNWIQENIQGNYSTEIIL
jgi:hypothetical protein